MILQIIFLIIGFIILIKGADYFVDGSSAAASNFKVSKILIGLTVIAFGTSAPEFAVSVKAIISNNHEIVFGNVIGSNILNILLIIGISSFFHSLNVKNSTIKKELPFTLLLTTLFVLLISDNIFDKNLVNAFTRYDGIILCLFFLIFIYYISALTLRNNNKINDVEVKKMKLSKSLFFIVIGIFMIVFGSNTVVDSATKIAQGLGVSKKFISLTIIALGTSLPELVTSVVATSKGEFDLVIGNVIGSNLFNLGIVIGLPVAIFGGTELINFNYIDLAVMLLSTILLYVFSFNDRKITRREGLIFLILFIIYYSFVILNG